MPDTIKTPAHSAVETRYLVMPGHANAFGTAFGGAIMSWIDMVAAMAAQKHCGCEVVTAGIDSVAFEEPVHVGDQDLLGGQGAVHEIGLVRRTHAPQHAGEHLESLVEARLVVEHPLVFACGCGEFGDAACAA